MSNEWLANEEFEIANHLSAFDVHRTLYETYHHFFGQEPDVEDIAIFAGEHEPINEISEFEDALVRNNVRMFRYKMDREIVSYLSTQEGTKVNIDSWPGDRYEGYVEEVKDILT